MRAKRLQHRLEYAAVCGMSRVVCTLPNQSAVNLGSMLGTLTYSVVGKRKQVAIDNLTRSLGGELDQTEIRRIARELYQNLGRGLAEFARFPVLAGERIQDVVTIEGREHLDRALARGKGVIAIAGHLGNWELLGAAVAAAGYPVNFLVGEQKNLLVDRKMNDYRRLMGIGIIPMTPTLKGVVRALRANEIVAMLSDQDAGSAGLFVDFFGRKASTPTGAAMLALKLDAALLPSFIVRQGGARHTAIIEEPMLVPSSGDQHEKASLLMQAFTSRLESYIRRYPAQWFWVHRRWKSKPNQ